MFWALRAEEQIRALRAHFLRAFLYKLFSLFFYTREARRKFVWGVLSSIIEQIVLKASGGARHGGLPEAGGLKDLRDCARLGVQQKKSRASRAVFIIVYSSSGSCV